VLTVTGFAQKAGMPAQSGRDQDGGRFGARPAKQSCAIAADEFIVSAQATKEIAGLWGG